MDTIKTPRSGESLAGYVARIRKELNLTQFERELMLLVSTLGL
ncbi:hypothetical protein [Brasilonema sp. UFV-L1]